MNVMSYIPAPTDAITDLARSLATKSLDPEAERKFRASYEEASRPGDGFLNLCPTFAFLEGVFRVTGVPDCGPNHVIAAIRLKDAALIEAVHAELVAASCDD
jgi:hypothetical protein